MAGQTLATVLLSPIAVSSQSLALCRSGHDVFGFVQPEGPRRFCVRHRSGILLLNFVGDLQAIDVVGINPCGNKVCWFQKIGDECVGRALQHVDAGLVICSMLASHMHQKMMNKMPIPSVDPFVVDPDFQGETKLVSKEGASKEDQPDAVTTSVSAPEGSHSQPALVEGSAPRWPTGAAAALLAQAVSACGDPDMECHRRMVAFTSPREPDSESEQ